MKNTNLEKTTFCNRHKNAQTDRSNHDIDVSALSHEPQTHEVEDFDKMGVQTTKMPLIFFELWAIVNFRCLSLLNLVTEKEESAVFKTTTNPTSRGRYLKREQ